MTSRPLLGLLFLAALTATASAQSGIAVVDFEKCLLAHPKAEELKAKLQAQSQNAASIVIAESDKLKALKSEVDEYRRKGLSMLSTNDRIRFEQVQQQALQVQDRLLELDQKTVMEMQKMRLDGRKEIAQEIQALVKEVNNGRFAVVLDLSFISPEGLPQVLDYPGATDITEEVLARLPKS